MFYDNLAGQVWVVQLCYLAAACAKYDRRTNWYINEILRANGEGPEAVLY